MKPNPPDFSQPLAALTQRFSALGAKLAEAARALAQSGTLPPEPLLEELAAARGEFVDLRASVLEAAQAFSVQAAADVTSLAALQQLVRAVVEAAEEAARQAALAEARQRALAVIDQVLAVVHVDDPGFAPLSRAHAHARQVREAVLDPAVLESPNAQARLEGTPAFSALLTLIEGREALDDERFAELEDVVAQTFGRALAVAATRGKLVVGGAAPKAAPTTARGPRLVPSASAPASEAAAAAAAPASTRPAVMPVLAPPPPPPGPVPDSVEPITVAAQEPAGVQASGQDESAQWWVSAWARWTSWRGNMGFPEAVKAELGKYGYILSVPIDRSAEHEDGLLSYGYSLLIDYLERRSPGFVNKALNSLKTFTPGAHAPSVGVHLHNVLLDEGRLDEYYPEFVREVLVAAVPEPGLWTQARILDSMVETRVFTHPSARVGDGEHQSQRLTQDRQRFTDHRFTVPLAPFTARFFTVAADLKEPRAVEVRLSDGRNDSDQAWLMTLPPVGRADLKPEVRRLPPGGITLAGLGRDYASLWVAVFNADPGAERRYELTLSLHRDMPKAAAPGARPARAAP